MPKQEPPSKAQPQAVDSTTIDSIAVKCRYSRLLKLEELKTLVNPNNPNQHDEQQIADFSRILKFQGVRRAVLISKRSGLIVAGHGLLMAAEVLGMKMLPVDEQEFESEQQEHAHMLADNELTKRGITDFQMAAKLLDGMPKELHGFAGFAEHTLENLLQANWTPPVPKAPAPVTKGNPGDPAESISLTVEQRAKFEAAFELATKRGLNASLTEGQALVIICDEYLRAT